MPCRLAGFDNFSLRLRNSLAGFVRFVPVFLVLALSPCTSSGRSVAVHAIDGIFPRCLAGALHQLYSYFYAARRCWLLPFASSGLSFSWLVLANDWLDVVWLAPCFARRCLTFLVRSRLPIFSFKSFTASARRCSASFCGCIGSPQSGPFISVRTVCGRCHSLGTMDLICSYCGLGQIVTALVLWF